MKNIFMHKKLKAWSTFKPGRKLIIVHIGIVGVRLDLTANRGSRGGIIRTRLKSLESEKIPSLNCKLVPVKYQEYKYGLLPFEQFKLQAGWNPNLVLLYKQIII